VATHVAVGGTGVGVIVGASTTMVPWIDGLLASWYWYTPGTRNVKEKDCPGFSWPESHTPVSLVVVCGTVSWFVHLTC
jgi:hypothetical protein